MSLSSWRAWIEISARWTPTHGETRSLSSWRAWIEIPPADMVNVDVRESRSPHGERGLKSRLRGLLVTLLVSLSSWRAWIEIKPESHTKGALSRSPHGERGLKCRHAPTIRHRTVSLSSWRAWIEIRHDDSPEGREPRRSPHGERGLKYTLIRISPKPPSRSPHGERGLKLRSGSPSWCESRVALLMESVD